MQLLLNHNYHAILHQKYVLPLSAQRRNSIIPELTLLLQLLMEKARLFCPPMKSESLFGTSCTTPHHSHIMFIQKCNTGARNHPSATNRSDSLETLFKAITQTRNIDDRCITGAFGSCLQAFVGFVVENMFAGSKLPATSSASYADVFRHLTVCNAFKPNVFVILLAAL